MQVVFPKLYPWQEEVFNDIRNSLYDFYTVKARRQVGKSVTAVTALLYFAFKDRGISVCVEPTLAQSRRVFKQLINAVGGSESPVIKSANSTLLSLEFVNGSEIILKSAEQEEALRGMTVKKGILIIDEAAYVKDSIFEILYPVVDACKCPVLLISTPLFQSGEFYDKYVQGLEEGIVHSYDWSKYDTSVFLSPEKLEYYRKTVSPLKFRSEYLGQFIAEGSYVFGDFMGCVGEPSSEAPFYAGIDWATGSEDGDYTVITYLDREGRMTGVKSFKDITPTSLVDVLAKEINAKKSLKCVQVELNSIGKVYYDMLKQRVNVPVKGFTTTNDSKRRIIEQLITAFNNGKVRVVNEPELIRELQHYNAEKTSTGKLTYNGADGVHDDYVLSLAFAYDTYLHGNQSFRFTFV